MGGAQGMADSGGAGAPLGLPRPLAAAWAQRAATSLRKPSLAWHPHAPQIKRAYKAQIAKHHPDKPGGDAAAFARLHAAYEVLSDAGRRAGYDATGHVARSAEDEFADRWVCERGGGVCKVTNSRRSRATGAARCSFAGGSFGRGGAPQRRDEQLGEENMAENLVAQITQRRDEASHSAGFDAWMRGRGGVKTYTAQDVIADFGGERACSLSLPQAPIRSPLRTHAPPPPPAGCCQSSRARTTPSRCRASRRTPCCASPGGRRLR